MLIIHIDSPRRRYRTIGHRTERDRRCLSLVDPNNNNTALAVNTATTRKVPATHNRPVSPWMTGDASPTQQKNDALRRYSAATIRSDRPPTFDVDELPSNPPVPKPKMKKSETFYAKFVKNVLSSSRRQSKDAR